MPVFLMKIAPWVLLALAGGTAVYFATKDDDKGPEDPSFLAGQVAENVRQKGRAYSRDLVKRFQISAHIAPSGLYDAEVVSALKVYGVPNPPPLQVSGGAPAYFPGAPSGTTTAQDVQGVLQTVGDVAPDVTNFFTSIFGGNGDEDRVAASNVDAATALFDNGYGVQQRGFSRGELAQASDEDLQYLILNGQITDQQYQQAIRDRG